MTIFHNYLDNEIQDVASGGVAIGNYSSDFVELASAISIPFDNGTHSLPLYVVDPPSWLDGSGTVLSSGLYLAVIQIQIVQSPTSPGLYAELRSPFNADISIALDGLPVTNGNYTLTDIQALGTGDVPYSPGFVVKAQTDVTGMLVAFAYLSRLAY